MATASAVAFIVFSCKGKLSEAEDMDISQAPVQAVDSIFMTQSDKGVLQMRAVAPRMERYDNDTASFEKFPSGLEVYGYTEEGLLETQILSDEALHFKSCFDRNRVDFAEELLNQRNGLKLNGSCFLIASFNSGNCHVVGFLRSYVCQNGDYAQTAQ